MICCALGVFILSQAYSLLAWLFPRLPGGGTKPRDDAAAAWTLGASPPAAARRWVGSWEARLTGGLALVLLAVVSSFSVRALVPDLGPICGHGWDLAVRQFWKDF